MNLVDRKDDRDSENEDEDNNDELERDGDREPANIEEHPVVLEKRAEDSDETERLFANGKADAVWDEMDIEVTPGVVKRLIGSDETLKAFDNDACVEVLCMACTVELACTMECEAVICPLCLSLSPLDNGVANDCVGLGLQLD